jgi:hypothetical protein
MLFCIQIHVRIHFSAFTCISRKVRIRCQSRLIGVPPGRPAQSRQVARGLASQRLPRRGPESLLLVHAPVSRATPRRPGNRPRRRHDRPALRQETRPREGVGLRGPQRARPSIEAPRPVTGRAGLGLRVRESPTRGKVVPVLPLSAHLVPVPLHPRGARARLARNAAAWVPRRRPAATRRRRRPAATRRRRRLAATRRRRRLAATRRRRRQGPLLHEQAPSVARRRAATAQLNEVPHTAGPLHAPMHRLGPALAARLRLAPPMTVVLLVQLRPRRRLPVRWLTRSDRLVGRHAVVRGASSARPIKNARRRVARPVETRGRRHRVHHQQPVAPGSGPRIAAPDQTPRALPTEPGRLNSPVRQPVSSEVCGVRLRSTLRSPTT